MKGGGTRLHGEDGYALKNEYLKVLKGRYLKAGNKKVKSKILDEYCLTTGRQGSTSSGKCMEQILDQGKGRKGRRYTMAKLKLPWLRYGKSSLSL